MVTSASAPILRLFQSSGPSKTYSREAAQQAAMWMGPTSPLAIKLVAFGGTSNACISQ
jgi:hypothetical protein